MVKILVVEDDPLMSRMYERIFTFEKYDVVLAHDGEEGLSKIAAEKPTLVLLDVMMPKMNGMEVLEKVKADPNTKSIPIVMLTNLAGQQDAEAALSKGAVKYIIKSEHDPKEISEMVKEILAGYTRNEVPQAVVTTEPTTTTTPVSQVQTVTSQPVAPVGAIAPAAGATPVPPVINSTPTTVDPALESNEPKPFQMPDEQVVKS